MGSLLFLPGRVVAKTPEEAITKIKERAESKGFELVGPVSPYPCRVQHLNNGIWWEYYANVKNAEG